MPGIRQISKTKTTTKKPHINRQISMFTVGTVEHHIGSKKITIVLLPSPMPMPAIADTHPSPYTPCHSRYTRDPNTHIFLIITIPSTHHSSSGRATA
jgi:hypothetical protein